MAVESVLWAISCTGAVGLLGRSLDAAVGTSGELGKHMEGPGARDPPPN